jgi:hypothetical protein
MKREVESGSVLNHSRSTKIGKKHTETLYFRYINEQLYSQPSGNSVAMFKKDPALFSLYHQVKDACKFIADCKVMNVQN